MSGLERRSLVEIDRGGEVLQTIPVVGIVGPMASGKETVAKILGRNFAFSHHVVSDSIREYMKNAGMPEGPHKREIFALFAQGMQDFYGQGFWGRMVLSAMERTYTEKPYAGACIEGLRLIGDVQALSEKLQMHIVWINADTELRYQRSLRRERAGDVQTRRAFFERDSIENAWMEPIRQLAVREITNEGSEEQLEKDVMDFALSTLALKVKK